MILSENKGILPQMNSGGKCRVYAALKCSESWLNENPLPEDGRREGIRKLFEGWCQGDVEDMIMASEEDAVVPRKIYMHHPETRWESEMTGLTVIGE